MTVHIARCPEHGLHGERSEGFVCGGEVEQVEMAPVDVDAATERVMAFMVRTYGAMPSDETRLQARRLALAALYEVADHDETQQARPVRPKASNPQPEPCAMTVWEKAGIIAAMVIAAIESLAIITIQATRTAREPDTLELAGLTAAVGQPPGGDHEYQLAHAEGWLPAHDGTAWEWKR